MVNTLKPPPAAAAIDRLFLEICRLHYERDRALFQSLGLYRGQPPLLHLLWQHEGMTQVEMADALGISAATLTRMAQRMEKAGFLQRQPDPEDQRVSRVFLTEQGRGVYAQVETLIAGMADETLAGLNDQERVELHRVLLHVRGNLTEMRRKQYEGDPLAQRSRGAVAHPVRTRELD